MFPGAWAAGGRVPGSLFAGAVVPRLPPDAERRPVFRDFPFRGPPGAGGSAPSSAIVNFRALRNAKGRWRVEVALLQPARDCAPRRAGHALPREQLRALHEVGRAPPRGRRAAVRAAGASARGGSSDRPPARVGAAGRPAGLHVFNFTVLLHEVVHHAVFARRRPGAERALGCLYAVPSGISATQFTRWHLDHHAELGSDEDDPKRHHLSPKRNARWFKLLYCTPALFPIYFRAARREAPPIRRRCSADRARSAGCRSRCTWRCSAAIWWLGRRRGRPPRVRGPGVLRVPGRVHAEPAGPALRHRSVRSRQVGHADARHWFWDLAFLNSNYHLEHHYFPGVPFYRLPALQRALMPFYERRGMRWQAYRGCCTAGSSRTGRRTRTGRGSAARPARGLSRRLARRFALARVCPGRLAAERGSACCSKSFGGIVLDDGFPTHRRAAR